MEEKILISIKVDQSEAIKNSAELDKEIKKLTEATKALAKAEGDNSIAIAENQALIRSLSAEKREQNKIIDQSVKAMKSESGSLSQQKAQLAILTQEYNNLSEEQRLNSDEGKKLQADVLALTNNLKANERAVGDNRRNVGNYSDSLKKLEADLAKINDAIIANSQSGKGTAADMAKMSKEADILAGLIERNEQGFKNTTQEIKANTVALSKMSNAGLQGTDSYKRLLKETAELKDGLEDLKDEMGSVKGSGVEKLNSSMQLMQKGISEFDGKAMKDGLKGVGAAMSALPILLIISGIAYLQEKFDFIGKTITWFTDLLGLTSKAAQEAADKMGAAMQKSTDMIVQGYDRQIKMAEADGKNTSAMEIQKQEAIQNTTRARLAQLLSLKELSDEQVKQVDELTKLSKDTEAEIYTIKSKAKADEKELNKKTHEDLIAKSKEAAEKQKEIDEKRKQHKIEVAQFNYDLAVRQISALEDSLTKELALYELKAKKEYDIAKKNKQDIKALDEVQNAERANIYNKWNLKELSDNKTKADKIKSDNEKKYTDELKQTDEFFKVLNTKKAEQLAAGEITKKQFDDAAKDSELLQLEAKLQLAKDHGQSTIDLENEIANKKIDIYKVSAEKQAAIELQKSERQLQMIKDISDAATNIIQSSYDQQGFNFQKFKKQFILGLLDMLQKVLQAQIASATITSLSSAQSVATGGTLGVTQAAILSGLMSVAFAVAKAEISRAAGGGDFVTNGPTLMMVGDNPGGAERVQVTPLSGKGQTYISPSSGIAHFAGGGSMSTDGGYGSRSAGSTAQSDAALYNIKAALENMPVPILKITDLNRVQERAAEITDLASV